MKRRWLLQNWAWVQGQVQRCQCWHATGRSGHRSAALGSGSKSLLSAFLHMLPHRRRIIGLARYPPTWVTRQLGCAMQPIRTHGCLLPPLRTVRDSQSKARDFGWATLSMEDKIKVFPAIRTPFPSLSVANSYSSWPYEHRRRGRI